MRVYRQTTDKILTELGSGHNGLTQEEAKKRLEQYGPNRLQEEKPKSILRVFLGQFADLLVIILIIAAVISMLTGNVESTIVILAVIIINAILGTVQHVKAEKSLQSLKALSTPMARIIRGGQQMEIDSAQIVPGDILMLEAGDLVPADGRVIENFSLQVNESALTGESESVNKTEEAIDKEEVALGDQINMVFSSSLVTYGRAIVVITGSGMHTEIGKIAALMNETKERKTPLQVSLDNFSKKLSIGILIICALVFGLSLYRASAINTDTVLNSLMFAVALAVAAIPEALSSIVTIALAIGTSKMAKQNAIIKNLNAVEGLGSVSVICSDKTGTLTQNRMTVKGHFTLDGENAKHLFLASILCNDSYVSGDQTLGDPTETALTDYYRTQYADFDDMLSKHPRLSEIPFDSDRKLMSTLHHIGGKQIMLTKGAVDVLASRLTHIADKGGIRAITDRDLEQIQQQNASFSENGLRVLAFAQKEHTEDAITLADENGYTFIGLISMIDPPREESAQAVADCHMAGIKPIMITGDHVTTASAIAKQIGILKEGDRAITGVELNQMSDEELTAALPKISVYARVSPEHKIRIVDRWQKEGNIVAMTGDGVNDAPALKKADIGIAMGITGTDVSKDAASMILTDDNFATIIRAVANGRNIYENIKNAIKFLLSGNTAGILAVVFCSLMALPVPFTAVHLLFINLLTDSLPAIAISMESAGKDLLREKPRDSHESILTKSFLIEVLWQGALFAATTIIAFYIGLKTDAATASAMAFATLCLTRLWHGFNSRGKQSVFRLGVFKNKYSIGAFVLGVLLISCVLFIPALHGVFDTLPLTGTNLLVIAVCSFVPTFLIQLMRVIREALSRQ